MGKPLNDLYIGLKESGYDVPESYDDFEYTLTQSGKAGSDSRHNLHSSLVKDNFNVPEDYESFWNTLFKAKDSQTSVAKSSYDDNGAVSAPAKATPKPAAKAPAKQPAVKADTPTVAKATTPTATAKPTPKAAAKPEVKQAQPKQPEIFTRAENWMKNPNKTFNMDALNPTAGFGTTPPPTVSENIETHKSLQTSRDPRAEIERREAKKKEAKKIETKQQSSVPVWTDKGLEFQSSYYVDAQAKRRAKEFVDNSGVDEVADGIIQKVVDDASFSFKDMTLANTVGPIMADVEQGALAGITLGSAMGATGGSVVGPGGTAVGGAGGAATGAAYGSAVGFVKGVIDVYRKQMSEKTSPKVISEALVQEENLNLFRKAVLGKVVDEDGKLVPQVREYARRAGMQPEDYVKKYILPDIARAIQAKIEKYTYDRFAPKDAYDYIMQGLSLIHI